ncbi:MAG: dihydroorotate dehydrogenase-like protein [Methylicorpusculum sp.]|uniref:dihydroorotate dehydrogenase-like protein n=1 Tax=Methylicorpusculum sp. TaxID=2713644 RepID=UPI00271CA062|nr:dihydroorotate dehydrogenase-like protein [Methylicorpusculum sp.]MDO8940415.1 dihydroorotate dehydrogenase-like protein [Methylicorpusculum sp.]MDP2204022.1 dihydroorotate dehydrogenase-like protein [Methylicorpusculum sp.]
MNSIDLSTDYLGLKLANPLIASASPLSRSIGSARQLEDAGAAAIVMYSLFEEELRHQEEETARFMIHQDIGFGEADSFLPFDDRFEHGLDQYLNQLSALKKALDIPVIASLNGVSLDGWIDHGKLLQEAGADALELNVYYLSSSIEESGEAIESRYVELLKALRRKVSIPIAMKISPYFSSPAHFIRRLDQAGADGVVLFNRFYQPDIDLDTLQVISQLQWSRSADIQLSLRWVALLYGKLNLSLATTSGAHNSNDVLKLLLAGADAIQLCSVLLEHGPAYLSIIKEDLTRWLETKEYAAVSEIKGLLSQKQISNPQIFERSNYINLLDGYSRSEGVRS